MALVELEQRVDDGQTKVVERLLAEFPAISNEPACVVELIYSEYVALQRQGIAVDGKAYLVRFPAYGDKLKRLLQIDEAIWVGESTKMLDSNPTHVASAERRRPDPPPIIPDYEILESIGQGAMGVVYRARHVSLDRVVALKMIRSGVAANSDELARFRLEGQAVASLDHANVVQIFDVGEIGGRPYFSQEYVEGGNLKDRLRRGELSPLEAADIVEKIALAIHFAHQRGIVHRDLKPSNVLLTLAEEPKVSDFGLAKRLDEESEQTKTGVLIGTPSYMAPEQVNRKHGDIGVATDVYGLGAILYELLTSQAPFAGSSVWDTVSRVCLDDPSPIRTLAKDVPSDLATICHACLEKRPEDRYPSALELAEDLRRFQAKLPIQVRRVSPIRRLSMWAKRKPGIAALLAMLLVGMAVSMVVVSVVWSERSKRLASIRRDVDAELQQVEDYQSIAANSDEIDMDAWAEALACARRAETLLGSVPQDDPRHAQVLAAAEDLQRDVRIRDFRETLNLIRLRNRHLDQAAITTDELDRRYRLAFNDFGIDPESDLSHDIATKLGDQNLDWFVYALDEWAQILKSMERVNGQRTGWRRVSQVAEQLDVIDFRKRVRDAWRKSEPDAFRPLIAEALASSNDLETKIILASDLRDIGEVDSAIQILEQAYWQVPGDYWVNMDLAILMQMVEPVRLDEALRYAQCAISISPNYAGGYAATGDVLLRQAKYEDAIRLYRRCIELNPSLEPVRNNIAIALIRMDRTEEAYDELMNIKELGLANSSTLVNLGGVAFNLRKHELAREVFEQLVEMEPNRPTHMYQLAMAHMELGQFEQSIQWLNACLELPGPPTSEQMAARSRLAFVEALQEVAVDMPESLDELTNEVSITDVLGYAQVSFLRGNYQNSIDFYEVLLDQADLFEDAREIEAVQHYNAAIAAALAAHAVRHDSIGEHTMTEAEFYERAREHFGRALDCLLLLKEDEEKREYFEAIAPQIADFRNRFAFRKLQTTADLEASKVPDPTAWLELWSRADQVLDR